MLKKLLPSYVFGVFAGAVLLIGAILLVEINYHLSGAAAAPTMSVFGVVFDPHAALPWLISLVLIAAGLWLTRMAAARMSAAWGVVALELQAMRANTIAAAIDKADDVPPTAAEEARP